MSARVVVLNPTDVDDLVWFLQELSYLPQQHIAKEAQRLLILIGSTNAPPEATQERLRLWSAGARLWRNGVS